MRVVLQRVQDCTVYISAQKKSQIPNGLLLLLGYAPEDTMDDVQWVMDKILKMRIFADAEGKMNRSVADVEGALMLVSQFTLFASTLKGNRPSYTRSAEPRLAESLYLQTIDYARSQYDGIVETGTFGADMQVTLTNDGPVTIIIDSQNRE